MGGKFIQFPLGQFDSWKVFKCETVSLIMPVVPSAIAVRAVTSAWASSCQQELFHFGIISDID